MKFCARFYSLITAISTALLLLLLATLQLSAQDAHFHNAPAASAQQRNPVAGQHAAVLAGSRLYATNCSGCHGPNGQGMGNVPDLAKGPTQTAPDGEVFWFITTGSLSNGMPAWNTLSEQQRWQLVAFLKSLKTSAKD